MASEKKLYKERKRLQIRQDKTLKELRDQEYSRKINVDNQKVKPAWDRAHAQLNAACQAVDASSGLPTARARCSGSAAPELSSSPVAAELAAFIDGWGKVLECLHCAEVLKSIKNFASATHALYCAPERRAPGGAPGRKYSRELDRKSQMLQQGASRRGGAALAVLWGTVDVDG
jgi:hypothetical protein